LEEDQSYRLKTNSYYTKQY